MDRRKALKRTAFLLGGVIIGSELFLSGCVSDKDAGLNFSTDDISLMDEIGETILPDSDRSPGAKAAEIGQFMSKMVSDCYAANEQTIFKTGLNKIDGLANKKHSKSFVELTFQQKTEMLVQLDREVTETEQDGPPHFFALMKQLTLLGYFSSEIGVTQALRYDPVPGGYDGCVPLEQGQSAWYGPTSSIG